jgi:hypothetical protein
MFVQSAALRFRKRLIKWLERERGNDMLWIKWIFHTWTSKIEQAIARIKMIFFQLDRFLKNVIDIAFGVYLFLRA